MSIRKIEGFDSNESLYRRFGYGDWERGSNKIKCQSIRVQTSIVRGKFGASKESTAIMDPDRDGVAEIVANEVEHILINGAAIYCIDSPLENIPQHAIIALHIQPGKKITDEEIKAAQKKLASLMKIVKEPTRKMK